MWGKPWGRDFAIVGCLVALAVATPFL